MRIYNLHIQRTVGRQMHWSPKLFKTPRRHYSSDRLLIWLIFVAMWDVAPRPPITTRDQRGTDV